MNIPGYYSSGQFARMAGISLRTVRFYDKQNILKPSFVTTSGARFYTDSDFARLQQILLLKYLGFSLDDIKEMTIDDADSHFMLHSLKLQKKLVEDRIEQMQLVSKAIDDTIETIEQHQETDWSRMLALIHLTGMEKSLRTQYQNATNISARIRLHTDYSLNKQGWFPWIYAQCCIRDGIRILELGCGNGALWTENMQLLPAHLEVVLSDVSEGMLRDARRSIGAEDERFRFQDFDCHQIPYPDDSFDLVIANHVLFYCNDIPRVLREVRRVLKPTGQFLCSTYGPSHMKEIGQLVYDFDQRIRLSAEHLYEQFGLENGMEQLMPFFSEVLCRLYEDAIQLDQAAPLIEYILSCHGNQNQYLLERYIDFRSYVEKKVRKGFHITKEAGIFLCSNKNLEKSS